MTTAHAGGRSAGWFVRTFRPSVLGGGEPTILNKVNPKERRKFAAMGFVLLSTAGLAGLSAAFGVRMALNIAIPAAILIGIVWALVIINLDRILVISMGATRSVGKLIALAVPRVVLAVIIGSVISTPITLAIFAKEIASEVQVLQAEDDAAFQNQLNSDPGFRTIPTLQHQVDKLRTVIVAGGQVNVDADPSVQAALKQVSGKQAIYDQQLSRFLTLQHAAQCELDGTCGTGKIGDGDAEKQASAAADQQKTVTDAAAADLADANNALAQVRTNVSAEAPTRLADAESDLATTQTKLDAQQTRKAARVKSHQAHIANADGLLYRLRALSQLTHDNGIMAWAHWLLWALFTCIELLPVLVKVLMNLGEPTEYDVEAERQAKHTAGLNQIEGEMETFAADDLLQKRKMLVEDIHSTWAQHQKKVIEAALKLWAVRAEKESQRQLDEYEQSLNGPVPSLPNAPIVLDRTVDLDGANGSIRTPNGGNPGANGRLPTLSQWRLPKQAP